MTKQKAKRVRILYTNGQQTYCLYQLNHTGEDLYYGRSGAQTKSTYHASGVKHRKTTQGEYVGRNKETPLKEVTHRQLICLPFTNSIDYFNNNPKFNNPSQKTVDASLVIDSRSIPNNAICQISIGVVAPIALQMVYFQTMADNILPKNISPGSAKQVLILTDTAPWIYAILYYK